MSLLFPHVAQVWHHTARSATFISDADRTCGLFYTLALVGTSLIAHESSRPTHDYATTFVQGILDYIVTHVLANGEVRVH